MCIAFKVKVRCSYKTARQRNTGFAIDLIRTPTHADIDHKGYWCNDAQAYLQWKPGNTAANKVVRDDVEIEEANRNQTFDPETSGALNKRRLLKPALKRLRQS